MPHTSTPSRRMILRGLAAGAGAGLLPSGAPAAAAERPPSEAISIGVQPIAHFARGRPGLKRFGDLEFRGGVVARMNPQVSLHVTAGYSTNLGGCDLRVFAGDIGVRIAW